MDAISSSTAENHTIRNAVIIASVGAGSSAGASAYYQHHLLHDKKSSDKFVKSVQESRDALAKQGKEPSKIFSQFQDAFVTVVKKAKFDSKLVQKAGVYGAAVCGGLYIAFKGLTSLFEKN